MPTALTIRPLTRAIGAEVDGVDLREPLSDDLVAELRQALLTHSVIFFRDQHLDTDEQLAFASRFGAIVPSDVADASSGPTVSVIDTRTSKGYTNAWHADHTWWEHPPMGAVLCARALPPVGGDTAFSSMTAAYDALSRPLRDLVDHLHAVHTNASVIQMVRDLPGWEVPDLIETVHPVVWEHPEHGRRFLYVTPGVTTSILEVTPLESQSLLAMLFAHVANPELQCRLRWEVGSVAFWDNRSAQHFAIADYTEPRVMQRVLVAGTDRPVGPGDR